MVSSMSMVDRSEFYEAIELFDVESWAVSRGAIYSGGSGYELVMECPVCGKQKLCVSIAKRSWHCWTCQGAGSRGGLIALIAMVDGLRRGDVVDYVVSEARRRPQGGTLRRFSSGSPGSTFRWAPPVDWPRGWRPITPELYGDLPYLARRGIAYDDVRQYGLVVCTVGRFRQRLIFPVFERGRLVCYQGRAMWDASEHDFTTGPYIKCINAKRELGAATTSDVLFNLDRARTHARVAIVEGPIDAIRTGADAVCSFGKALSQAQIQKLRRAGVVALDLMWDGPSETEPRGARREMERVSPMLADLFDLRVVYLPSGDPGSMERNEIDRLRSAACLVKKA